jgi:hypothetical protein
VIAVTRATVANCGTGNATPNGGTTGRGQRERNRIHKTEEWRQKNNLIHSPVFILLSNKPSQS